ncbi:MAG: heme exporter protein CcmB, partial [Gemmatimonadetes bacterium]|nr:heme exporter protein CcmB [Gemmatimonadota bacterium]
GAVRMIRAAAAIFRKDLRIELRTGESVPAMVLFSVIVFVLFHFGLDRDRLEGDLASGVLWVTILLAAGLCVSRLFAGERENGAIDGLLLALGAVPRGTTVLRVLDEKFSDPSLPDRLRQRALRLRAQVHVRREEPEHVWPALEQAAALASDRRELQYSSLTELRIAVEPIAAAGAARRSRGHVRALQHGPADGARLGRRGARPPPRRGAAGAHGAGRRLRGRRAGHPPAPLGRSADGPAAGAAARLARRPGGGSEVHDAAWRPCCR